MLNEFWLAVFHRLLCDKAELFKIKIKEIIEVMGEDVVHEIPVGYSDSFLLRNLWGGFWT